MKRVGKGKRDKLREGKSGSVGKDEETDVTKRKGKIEERREI